MQHFTFTPSSIKTETFQYEKISGPAPNSQVNISSTNEMEPGSIPTLSLDQILTNYCDITPSTALPYFPFSTSTNSVTFNSVISSFDSVPPRTISVLETPLNSKHTLEPNDVKSFAERTVLLPNPPCYFPCLSNEAIGDIQISNPPSCTEDSLNSTYPDYFQMKLINDPNQTAPTPVIASCSQVDNIYNDETDSEDRFNWWERHPDRWTLPDILDWIRFTIHRNTANPTFQCGDGFKDLTSGACLHYMSYEEFLMRDPQYGHLLFHYFQQLLDFHAHTSIGSDMRGISSSQQFGQTNIRIDQFSAYASDGQNTQPNTFVTTENGSGHANSYTNLVVPKYQVQFNETDTRTRLDASFHITKSGRNELVRKTFDQYENPKRKPGRPRLHPCFRSNEASNKKMKILPLWEFIYSTLQNGHFNPSVIKWEDEANGKFRFVHSEKFAKLWGNAKNNDNMNYEKLSRAMRHYYGKDIMERVEGRRLVYRFLSPALERLRKKQDPNVPFSETQRPQELMQSI